MKSFIVLAVILGVASMASAQCPRIFSRAEWGARSASSTNLPTYPATYTVIHHTAGAHCSTQSACMQEMRNIQNYHMNSLGWSDIGYNFLIGGDGQVYEGRGWRKQGAHASGWNSNSHGFSYMGTYTTTVPTAAQIHAGKQLVQCGIYLGHIRSNHGLIGHRQVGATECPGNALYREIQTWPNYRANP